MVNIDRGDEIVNKSSQKSRQQNPEPHKRPHFSKAVVAVAKKNLKEFERKSDEEFLIRAKIDRKLHSL